MGATKPEEQAARLMQAEYFDRVCSLRGAVDERLYNIEPFLDQLKLCSLVLKARGTDLLDVVAAGADGSVYLFVARDHVMGAAKVSNQELYFFEPDVGMTLHPGEAPFRSFVLSTSTRRGYFAEQMLLHTVFAI